MKVYYNDRGFQLGNLLYLLLQAHKDRLDGIADSYVLRTGYYAFAQTFFPKTAELFSKANGLELEEFDYFQISGVDYLPVHVDSFVARYLQKPILQLSREFEEKDITIAIRRTDFINQDRYQYYGYDMMQYVVDCLDKIAELEDDNFQTMTIRITSDDIEWCREELVPSLMDKYPLIFPIVVEEQDIRDNFVQLFNCRKYFISANSTYCYWIGYVLRIAKPEVQVFAPNFNTMLIEDGRQIADARNWILMDVQR